MAKRKKPPVPRRTPRRPELSRLDKLIYNIMMVLSPFAAIALLVILIRWQERFAAEPGALAANHFKWGYILAFLWLLYHARLFLDWKHAKIPLFGRRDITYGPPEFLPVYPIFRPHPKVRRSPEEEKSVKARKRFYTLGWAVVLAALLLTLLPRDMLMKDGSVKEYNCFNMVSGGCGREDVDRICLRTFLDGGRRNKYPNFEIELTAGRETYRFQGGDALGDRSGYLRELIQLREAFAADGIPVEIDLGVSLDSLITRKDFTEEEAALLHQLFGT